MKEKEKKKRKILARIQNNCYNRYVKFTQKKKTVCKARVGKAQNLGFVAKK